MYIVFIGVTNKELDVGKFPDYLYVVALALLMSYTIKLGGWKAAIIVDSAWAFIMFNSSIGIVLPVAIYVYT